MKNSKIEKLITEKATKYPDISVRQYLLKTKGMSESQYKKAIEANPVAVWQNRQLEIQGQISNRTIEENIAACIELNLQYLNSAQYLANLGITMANRNPKSEKKLSAATNILFKSQEIFHKAVSFSDKLEADKLKAEKEKAHKMAIEKKSEFQKKMEAMDYDDVAELIEMRREQKAEEKAKAETDASLVDLNF